MIQVLVFLTLGRPYTDDKVVKIMQVNALCCILLTSDSCISGTKMMQNRTAERTASVPDRVSAVAR